MLALWNVPIGWASSEFKSVILDDEIPYDQELDELIAEFESKIKEESE